MPSSAAAGRAGLGVIAAGYAFMAAAIVPASCMHASIGFGMGMLAAPIVAGALLLVALPERALAYTLAAVVLAGVALTGFGWMPTPHRRNLVLAGATSGLLGTATSIGGPPMALVWQNNTGARLRGTMSGFFLVGSLLSIALLALTGAIDHHTMVVFAMLVPAGVAGYLLSHLLNRHLDRQRQRWAAIAVSALGAVVLIVRQLVGG